MVTPRKEREMKIRKEYRLIFEFFEKNWRFLLFASIVASYVIWDVMKERREKEKKARERKDVQDKAERNKG